MSLVQLELATFIAYVQQIFNEAYVIYLIDVDSCNLSYHKLLCLFL